MGEGLNGPHPYFSFNFLKRLIVLEPEIEPLEGCCLLGCGYIGIVGFNLLSVTHGSIVA